MDRAGSNLLECLAAALPPPDVGAGPAPEVRYTVNREGPAGAGFRVWRDGEPALAEATADEALRWLIADIDGTVARRAPAGLFVHAGVVGWRGRAILVPGRSMTGKSTLVAALVRRGAEYYSDEYAVLDDEGRIHAYARAPVLRGGHDATLSTPAARAERRDPLPAALVVCTAYHPVARWRPEVIRGARAALCLMDNTVLARSEPGRTLRLAARLGAGIITLKGPRPEADEVAPRLLEWIDALAEERDPRRDGDEPPRARQVAWTATRLGHPSARIRPARHVRVANLLSSEEHRQLLDHVLAHESGFVTSGVLVDGARESISPTGALAPTSGLAPPRTSWRGGSDASSPT